MVVLLAYLAGTNHCALLEAFCAEAGCETHETCGHHDETGAAAGGTFCDLDKSMLGSVIVASAKMLVALGVLLLPVVFLWRRIRILITDYLIKPPLPRPLPDDWLGVIRRRHFILRAAGLARAP